MSVVVGYQTHGIADFTDSKRVSVHLSVVLLCVIVYFGLSFPMWLHMVSYIYMTKMHIFVCMRLCMRWVHVRVYARFLVWLCMVQGVPHQPHSVEWLLSMGCSETGFHIYYGMYVVLVSGIIQPTTIVEKKMVWSVQKLGRFCQKCENGAVTLRVIGITCLCAAINRIVVHMIVWMKYKFSFSETSTHLNGLLSNAKGGIYYVPHPPLTN